MTIAVIGLGYVGLPLSLQFARSGVTVLGLDIDPAKVKSLNAGRSYLKHIGSPSVREQVDAHRFSASSDFARVGETEAVIICVPTPLNKNREPDLSYIVNTGKAIAPHLRRDKAESGKRKFPWSCWNPPVIPAPPRMNCGLSWKPVPV